MFTGEEGGKAYKATEAGLDRVEFLLAPGPAEPLQPLRSVASGGESSRVMLALKAAPAAAFPASEGMLCEPCSCPLLFNPGAPHEQRTL